MKSFFPDIFFYFKNKFFFNTVCFSSLKLLYHAILHKKGIVEYYGIYILIFKVLK